MAYLQNGVCYADPNQAKADFISRIVDIQQRDDAIRVLQSLTQSELQRLMPDCVLPIDTFNGVFGATMTIVGLLISFRLIKKVVEL